MEEKDILLKIFSELDEIKAHFTVVSGRDRPGKDYVDKGNNYIYHILKTLKSINNICIVLVVLAIVALIHFW